MLYKHHCYFFFSVVCKMRKCYELLWWSFCSRDRASARCVPALTVSDIMRRCRRKERPVSCPLGGEERLSEILRECAKRAKICALLSLVEGVMTQRPVRGSSTHGCFSTQSSLPAQPGDRRKRGGVRQASDLLRLGLWTVAPAFAIGLPLWPGLTPEASCLAWSVKEELGG